MVVLQVEIFDLEIFDLEIFDPVAGGGWRVAGKPII